MTRRGRIVIATDASVNLKSGSAERYEILVVPRRFRVGRQSFTSVEGPTQFATERDLPELLPAQLEDFVSAYKQVSNATVVSIHSAGTLDDAAHQAGLARNLLSPSQDIQVFEAKTIDGGVQFLVQVAGAWIETTKEAAKEQVVALLERVQRDMITLLYAKGTGRLPCEPKPTLTQTLFSYFSSRMVLRLDNATGIFKQIVTDSAELQTIRENNREVILQWRRRNASEANHLVAEMAGRFGSDELELRDIYLKNPLFPDDFVGLVAVPNSKRVSAHIAWVKRWG